MTWNLFSINLNNSHIHWKFTWFNHRRYNLRERKRLSLTSSIELDQGGGTFWIFNNLWSGTGIQVKWRECSLNFWSFVFFDPVSRWHFLAATKAEMPCNSYICVVVIYSNSFLWVQRIFYRTIRSGVKGFVTRVCTHNHLLPNSCHITWLSFFFE